MKTPTGSPKKDRESSKIPSKVICSSSEFSTVKTPIRSPKKDRESSRIPSKLINGSSEFSTMKTPTGSPKKDRESSKIPSKLINSSSEFSTVKIPSRSQEKDRESPTNPVPPDLVSKHLKEASKNARSSKIQGTLFKPEAVAVNGDDIENLPGADLVSETTLGPEVLNKEKHTLLSRQQLVRSVPYPSTQRSARNKTEPEFETVLCSRDNKITPGLQVKVTSYLERKRTFTEAGTKEEQEQFKREETASPSHSRVRPCSIPPRANYRSKMEKYRPLQRSKNFTTSTTEEVASHASATANQVLSAPNPATVSMPQKSKS